MLIKGKGIERAELNFKGVSEIIVAPGTILVKEQLTRRQVEFEDVGDRYYTLKFLIPILQRYWTKPTELTVEHDLPDLVKIQAGPLTIELNKLIDYVSYSEGSIELTYEDACTISSATRKIHWVVGDCWKEEVSFEKYPYGNGEKKVVEIVCRDKICLIFSYSYEYRESVPRDIRSQRVELTVLKRPW
ncbi:MAG: hypothetical protein QXT58_05075 [Archaeoglobaceae archaeon]